jgi:membrane protein YqaA with SNARE-associated domain
VRPVVAAISYSSSASSAWPLPGLNGAGNVLGASANWIAMGFVIGNLSIGQGIFGHAHLLVRVIALRDETALKQVRVITVV